MDSPHTNTGSDEGNSLPPYSTLPPSPASSATSGALGSRTSTSTLTSSSSIADSREDKPALLLKSLAVYPNGASLSNRSPFAPSAKRRNSLQSLGSIAHLQHLYTRNGLASKVRPRVIGIAPLAVGQAAWQSVSEADSNGNVLPPTPVIPTHNGKEMYRPEPSLPKSQELKEAANLAWTECCQAWSLSGLLEKGEGVGRVESRQHQDDVEVARVIRSTQSTINAVRRYLLSLPPGLLDNGETLQSTTLRSMASKHTFRRQSSFFCFPRAGEGREAAMRGDNGGRDSRLTLIKQRSESNLREGVNTVPLPPPTTSTSPAATFSSIRMAALEVLVLLKQWESSDRHEGAIEDGAKDVSVGDVTWTCDEEGELPDFQRQTASLDEMDRERASVERYLKAVKGMMEEIERAMGMAQRVGNSGGSMLRLCVVPAWSTYSASDGLAGAVEIVEHFVPRSSDEHLSALLDDRRSLLEALSDGQLLCQAFNEALKGSKKAWGLINLEDLCDCAFQTGWSFRKRQNLTVWAAALKARYGVESDFLSPALVAQAASSDEKWMNMLQAMICQWAAAVAGEEREAE